MAAASRCAQVWHYREADPDLGAWQAKELLDHLEGVLANEPVEVISGQSIVEVKPQVGGGKLLAWDRVAEDLKCATHLRHATWRVPCPAPQAASSACHAHADGGPKLGCFRGALLAI